MSALQKALFGVQEGFCAVAFCRHNRSLRILAYNFLANAALYLFYQMTPFSEGLQAFNRLVFWRIAYYF